jgi:hypothetical protein
MGGVCVGTIRSSGNGVMSGVSAASRSFGGRAASAASCGGSTRHQERYKCDQCMLPDVSEQHLQELHCLPWASRTPACGTQCTFSLILRDRSRCQARSSAILRRLYSLARRSSSACCSGSSCGSSTSWGASVYARRELQDQNTQDGGARHCAGYAHINTSALLVDAHSSLHQSTVPNPYDRANL